LHLLTDLLASIVQFHMPLFLYSLSLLIESMSAVRHVSVPTLTHVILITYN